MKSEHELQPDWVQELASSPFNKPMFSEKMKASVLNSAASGLKRRKRQRPAWSMRIMIASVSLLLIAAVWGWRESPLIQEMIPVKGWGKAADWTPRNIYKEDGVDMLQVYQGGEYTAGTPAGAAWFLLMPIEKLENKQIEIIATHRDSGMIWEELPETTISGEMAYDESTRVVSRFGLPLSGLWRFDVMVDHEKYGDIVVDVPDSSWEPSPSFSSGIYAMTGVEGRLGFIHPPIIADQPNKYMWHFWGRDEELTGDLRITAVKRNTTEIIDVFESTLRPGKHNGADASLPTTMSLPSPGVWRLMASINGQLYGSVIVEVDDAKE